MTQEYAEFLAEAEDLIGQIGSGLLRHEEAIKAGGKINPEILNGIFRAVHTLKGLVGMYGRQEDMGVLTHALEDLLDQMRLGQVACDQKARDILFAASEKLELMLAKKPGEEKFGEVLTKINQAVGAANQPKQQAARLEASHQRDTSSMVEGVAIPPEVMRALTEYEVHRLAENIRRQANLFLVGVVLPLTNFDTALPKLTNRLKRLGEVIATVPMAESKKETMTFQVLFSTTCSSESLDAVLRRNEITLRVLKSGQTV